MPSTTRERVSTARGIATRTASPSAKVAMRSQGTARPARWDSSITGASFATAPISRVDGARRRRTSPMPPIRAPLPTGTTTAAGAACALAEDLGGDRAIALLLRRLVAVFEEHEPARARERPRVVLGAVEVVAALANIRSEGRDQGQLGARGAARNEHRGVEARAPGGPGGRGAVVAGRGRDDAARSLAPILLERGQRAAPLEGPELVQVLALPEDVAPARDRVGNPFQRRRELHARLL